MLYFQLADLVTNFWQVKHTHYHINSIPQIGTLPIVYSIIAGIAFGICAASFSKTIHYATAIFKNKIAYAPFRPFIGGIIVSLAVLAIGTTKYIGLGIPTILQSFDQQLPIYDFAIKMAFTILTLSAGFKG